MVLHVPDRLFGLIDLFFCGVCVLVCWCGRIQIQRKRLKFHCTPPLWIELVSTTVLSFSQLAISFTERHNLKTNVSTAKSIQFNHLGVVLEGAVGRGGEVEVEPDHAAVVRREEDVVAWDRVG